MWTFPPFFDPKDQAGLTAINDTCCYHIKQWHSPPQYQNVSGKTRAQNVEADIQSEFTFWPAHLTLLMPFLPHNLAEFCKLHLLDQSKIWVLSDPRALTPTHLQNEEPRHQSWIWAILFTICTVPTENDFSQRTWPSTPPVRLRPGHCCLQPAQRPRPGRPSSGRRHREAGMERLAQGGRRSSEGSSWGRSGMREALALLVLRPRRGRCASRGRWRGLGLPVTP